MSTYLKKWLAFAAIAAMLILPGCRDNSGNSSQPQWWDILEYTHDGCIYLRQHGAEVPLIHSASCNNPKHGGILQCLCPTTEEEQP